MITSPAFRGRRYAVLGLARSGLATVEALAASGAEVTAWDWAGRVGTIAYEIVCAISARVPRDYV